MKLAAIYCVWDDWDLLNESYKNIVELVDSVIIVYSLTSNFGENSERPTLIYNSSFTRFLQLEPDPSKSPRENETAKRNFGLQKARELGFTHFIMMDSDEMYLPSEFLKAKEHILKHDYAGSVCRTKVYFREPTLTVPDSTLVPFIHKITSSLKFGFNPKYPYAFEGVKREIRIDPTRQMNIENGVTFLDLTMHHMSWIRSDIQKKIRNSTARMNIEKSTILKDYVQAKEGYYCEFYKAKLQACENLFNIPRIVDDGICTQSPANTEAV